MLGIGEHGVRQLDVFDQLNQAGHVPSCYGNIKFTASMMRSAIPFHNDLKRSICLKVVN